MYLKSDGKLYRGFIYTNALLYKIMYKLCNLKCKFVRKTFISIQILQNSSYIRSLKTLKPKYFGNEMTIS
jgi:hypothetical protein